MMGSKVNDDAVTVAERTTNEGMFEDLPTELIHHIYSFFDIASLGNMAQVNCSGILSESASSNIVWESFVLRRFGTDHHQNHHNPTNRNHQLKEAFRTMSFCNRIPKSRYTSTRKPIFAKSGGGKHCNPVSSWVLLSHTPNCQTRRFPVAQYDHNMEGERRNDHSLDRFIELKVCLQNVKSNRGSITVDIMRATLDLMGSCTPQQLCQQPRILFHSRQEIPMLQGRNWNDGVELKPFEFCIVSMAFGCGSDTFETDVLARALALRIPMARSSEVITATFLPECDVWRYYTVLPGGCMSLQDKVLLGSA